MKLIINPATGLLEPSPSVTGFLTKAQADIYYWSQATAQTGLTGDKSGSFNLYTTGKIQTAGLYDNSVNHRLSVDINNRWLYDSEFYRINFDYSAKGRISMGGAEGASPNSLNFGNFAGYSIYGAGTVKTGNNIILGLYAGYQATYGYNLNLQGYQAGYGATYQANLLALGYKAGFQDGAINVATGTVASVVIINHGTGYIVGDVLTINGGNGDATFRVASVDAGNNDAILTIDSLYAGTGGYITSTASYGSTTTGGVNDDCTVFINYINQLTAEGTSILIGNYTSTGGFSDSVALGHGVMNSAPLEMNFGNVMKLTGIYNSDTPSSAFMTGATVDIGTNSFSGGLLQGSLLNITGVPATITVVGVIGDMPSPDCTGDYTYAGILNTQPYWSNGVYRIYYNDADFVYLIAPVGDAVNDYINAWYLYLGLDGKQWWTDAFNTYGSSGVVSGTASIAAPTSNIFGEMLIHSTLRLASGSITDTTGKINFGNERLTTTGQIDARNLSIIGSGFNGNTVTIKASDTIAKIGVVINAGVNATGNFQTLLRGNSPNGTEIFALEVRGSDQVGRIRVPTLSTTPATDSGGLAILTSGNAAQFLKFKGIALGTSYAGLTPGAGEIITQDDLDLTLKPGGTGIVKVTKTSYGTLLDFTDGTSEVALKTYLSKLGAFSPVSAATSVGFLNYAATAGIFIEERTSSNFLPTNSVGVGIPTGWDWVIKHASGGQPELMHLYEATGNTFWYGKFTTYNNVATEGYGVPAIVDHVALTVQAASIGATNFTNAQTAGLYEVDYYLEATTTGAVASTILLTFAFTDDAGATTVNSATLILTALGRTSGHAYVRLTSGAFTYATTLVDAGGLGRYALYMTCRRLN